METQAKADLAQEFEVAFWDYAALVTLGLKDLSRSGYQLTDNEQLIADGSSLAFQKIRSLTWTRFPLATRQDMSRARSHRESLRERLRRQN